MIRLIVTIKLVPGSNDETYVFLCYYWIYTEQQKKRPAHIFLSYLKLKYQKIYFWLNMNTTMCNHRIVVIFLGFAIPLAL